MHPGDMDGAREPLLHDESLLFDVKDEEERRRINAYRADYQNYRAGGHHGAKGEFTVAALQLQEEKAVLAFNYVQFCKIFTFLISGWLYIVGSFFFLEDMLESYPRTGPWLFIIGSIGYSQGAFVDLAREVLVLRGFIFIKDLEEKVSVKRKASISEMDQQRQLMGRLAALGRLANNNDDIGVQQVHINAGLLPTRRTKTMATSRRTTAARVDAVEKRMFEARRQGAGMDALKQERRQAVVSLIVAAVYFLSCSAGFIGGSVFFLPSVEESYPGETSASNGCWFFIIASITFILAALGDVSVLLQRAMSNSDPTPVLGIVIALLPLTGAAIWIAGSFVFLPDSGYDSALNIGPTCFIVGSFLFAASSAIALVAVIYDHRRQKRELTNDSADEMESETRDARSRVASAPALLISALPDAEAGIDENESTSREGHTNFFGDLIDLFSIY